MPESILPVQYHILRIIETTVGEVPGVGTLGPKPESEPYS